MSTRCGVEDRPYQPCPTMATGRVMTRSGLLIDTCTRHHVLLLAAGAIEASERHRYDYRGSDGWSCLTCNVPIRNNDCPHNANSETAARGTSHG